jgi:hypothetical protein
VSEKNFKIGISNFEFPMACSECKKDYDYYCCHDKNKLFENIE